MTEGDDQLNTLLQNECPKTFSSLLLGTLSCDHVADGLNEGRFYPWAVNVALTSSLLVT